MPGGDSQQVGRADINGSRLCRCRGYRKEGIECRWSNYCCIYFYGSLSGHRLRLGYKIEDAIEVVLALKMMGWDEVDSMVENVMSECEIRVLDTESA